MLLGRHSLVIGVCSLLLLSGCGYSSSGSSSGSTDAPGSGTGTSGGTSSGGPPSDPLGGGGGITGTNDFRRGNILDIFRGGFEQEGFQAKLLDVPGMEHDICDGETLSRALDFLEGGN